MIESPISKKVFFIAIIFSFLVCFLIFITNNFDGRTKIVFCDVGQGDGIYIRIKNQIDVLIDAGRNQKVLSCLGKYMPFWDKKIEITILTHSDIDHYGGFIYVVDHYQIGKMIVNKFTNKSVTFGKLKEKIFTKKINVGFYYAGDQISLLNDSLTFYWPKNGFDSLRDNDLSFVSVFKENNFRALFTGDASPLALSKISYVSLEKVDILQVPHHGSKNGLTKKILKLADPKVAVISVGKNNSYGHPHQAVLDILKAQNIKIRRTDEDGDIVFKL